VRLIFLVVFRIPLCLCEVISPPSLPGFRCVPITSACGARAGCPRPAGGRAPVTLRTLAGGGQPVSVCGSAARGLPGIGCGYRASGRAAGRPHGCIQIVQRELALLLRARRALLAAHFSSAIGPRRRARRTPVIALCLERLGDPQCMGKPLVLNHGTLIDFGKLVVRHIGQRHAVGPVLRFVKCDVRSRKSLFYRFHVVGVRRVRKPGIPLSVAYRCMHVWQRTCVKPSGQCSPAQATLEP
jgi:hypothetical protein